MYYQHADIQQWLNTANTYYATGQWPQVIEAYKKVLKAEENNMEALINITDCYLQMEMTEAAEPFAYRAFKLFNRIDDMVTVNYSCVLINNKDFVKAITILEDAHKLHSVNYLIYNNLGYCYYLTENYAKALFHYNTSIEINNQNPLAYCNRGTLTYFIFNDDLGIADLEKAYELGDYDAGILLSRIIKDKTLLT